MQLKQKIEENNEAKTGSLKRSITRLTKKTHKLLIRNETYQYTPCRHQNYNKEILGTFYTFKFGNLDEMDQFLKNTDYHTQYEIDNLSNHRTTKETELVILKFYKEK